MAPHRQNFHWYSGYPKVMSTEHSCTTPASQIKKREFTSPVFEIDTKKNKVVSVAEKSEATAEVDIRPDDTESEMADTESSMEKPTSIVIPESEMLKLSIMLKETFRGEIVGLVNGIVEGVLDGLNEQVSKLEETNKQLSEENGLLRNRVEMLERKVDQAERYSRSNCLRISGINETASENTDNIVLKLAADIDTDIQLPEIERSHRLGNPRKARSKPRDIIVKFSSYRNREKQRTLLKVRGHTGVFVNEDLTKFRSGPLYDARRLAKVNLVKGAWSSDGNVLVKDNDDKVHLVSVIGDLVQFGFLVMGPGQPSVPLRARRLAGLCTRTHAGAAVRSYAGVATDTSADMDHSGGHA